MDQSFWQALATRLMIGQSLDDLPTLGSRTQKGRSLRCGFFRFRCTQPRILCWGRRGLIIS